MQLRQSDANAEAMPTAFSPPILGTSFVRHCRFSYYRRMVRVRRGQPRLQDRYCAGLVAITGSTTQMTPIHATLAASWPLLQSDEWMELPSDPDLISRARAGD